ncbi:MAG: PIN domain-containing protein, partial [bacterium]
EALAQGRIALTPPVMAEVLRGAMEDGERENLEHLLGALPFLEVTRADGLEAGRIGYRLSRAGLRVPTMDLLIAAVCIRGEHQLIQRDRHFPLIARHSALRLAQTARLSQRQ